MKSMGTGFNAMLLVWSKDHGGKVGSISRLSTSSKEPGASHHDEFMIRNTNTNEYMLRCNLNVTRRLIEPKFKQLHQTVRVVAPQHRQQTYSCED